MDVEHERGAGAEGPGTLRYLALIAALQTLVHADVRAILDAGGVFDYLTKATLPLKCRS